MNKTVYTALIGNYEELKEPTVISDGWDYVCYTDQPITSDVWKIIPVTFTGDPQRFARKIKILFHQYVYSEYSLWLDAAFQINVDLNYFWGRGFKLPFSCPKHPVRDCVYLEVKSCLVNGRGDAEQVIRQGDKYKELGIPYFNGVITSGVLLRQRTKICMELCEKWHEELQEHSVRDQIAFAKVSIPYNIHTFVWDYSQSKELKYYKHFKHRQ